MRSVAYAMAVLTLVTSVSAAAAARDDGSMSRSVDFHHEVDAGYGGSLRLTAGPHGDVTIRGGRVSKISIDARIQLHAESSADLEALEKVVAVSVDPSPTTVEIETKGPHDKKWMKQFKGLPKSLTAAGVRVDYVVTVPEYTSLTVAVSDGTTVLENVSGILGIASEHGDIRLANVSGSTQVGAAGGSLTIETADRSWRGGNLSASCSGDLHFVVPAGFSAALDATAAGGIAMHEGGEAKEVGRELEERLGNGGAAVTLVAGGAMSIELVPR